MLKRMLLDYRRNKHHKPLSKASWKRPPEQIAIFVAKKLGKDVDDPEVVKIANKRHQSAWKRIKGKEVSTKQ